MESYHRLASLSFGLETVGGIMTKIIPRSTIILTKNLSTFTTNQNNKHAALWRYLKLKNQWQNNNLLENLDLSVISKHQEESSKFRFHLI